jgi:dihydrofolate reductase
MKPRISAIASVGENRELGKDGTLAWRIKGDLRRVKELTTGHTLIMGRKTYESIGRPLPNRTNIVVTHDGNFRADGCVVVHSLDEAFAKAAETEPEEIFVFGGAQIYAASFPRIERLYLTKIHAADPDADTFFPDYAAFSRVIEREAREEDGLPYEWLTLERK